MLQRPSSAAPPSKGPGARFFEWRDGEKYLADLYGANANGVNKQVRASTAGCIEVCTSKVRIFDVFVDGVAHESKVGHEPWSKFTRNQISEGRLAGQEGRASKVPTGTLPLARAPTPSEPTSECSTSSTSIESRIRSISPRNRRSIPVS